MVKEQCRPDCTLNPSHFFVGGGSFSFSSPNLQLLSKWNRWYQFSSRWTPGDRDAYSFLFCSFLSYIHTDRNPQRRLNGGVWWKGGSCRPKTGVPRLCPSLGFGLFGTRPRKWQASMHSCICARGRHLRMQEAPFAHPLFTEMELQVWVPTTHCTCAQNHFHFPLLPVRKVGKVGVPWAKTWEDPDSPAGFPTSKASIS